MKIDARPFDDWTSLYWLTQGMARTLGVNLSEEISRGRITRMDLDEMIAICAACPSTNRCLSYMATGGNRGAGPPSYCLNHKRIEALLAAMPAEGG